MSGRSKKAEVNISTVGVDVCDWIYPKKTDFAFGRADNRTSIKFSTWDFGGQVRLGRGGVGDVRELSKPSKLASGCQFSLDKMVTLLIEDITCPLVDTNFISSVQLELNTRRRF